MYERPVAIITGAGNGIGRSTALRFARDGYALAIVDMDEAALKSLASKLEEVSCDFLCIAGDLQSNAFVSTIAYNTYNKWKRIDVLVNNAGWRTLETMRTISLENWERTIRICLTAPAFLSRYAAEIMEKNDRPGIIINISSVMSRRTGGYSPAYCVCKGAIESLTYELSVLLGPKQIRVVAIAPGNINTTISNDKNEGNNNIHESIANDIVDQTPLGRGGQPEEIANIAYWLCSEDASFITGTTIVCDGGLTHNFNSYPMKHLQFPNEF